RDIKPSNVFLVERRLDRVKVLDYGVARRAGMDVLTMAGALIGTPAYMAPEQARGDRNVDARADVYALGALLFRCVAGRPPFVGTTPDEVITGILRRTPPRLGELADVSRDLEALVARMLHKLPARRPADGSAALAALVGIEAPSSGPGGGRRHSSPRSRMTPAPRESTLTSTNGLAAHGSGGRVQLSSVAVLSFLDMSSARDQDYLCDGIADELIDVLAHVDGLRVAARASSLQFKSRTVDTRAVGTRLGVDAVLEGGVRKSGDRLRVNVRLIDVADGCQRWSHRFDVRLGDVFDVQDQIAGGVATALRGVLSGRERAALRRPATGADAYEHFLRGRQLCHAGTVSAFTRAEPHLRRAVELDPGYAPAQARLAQVHSWSVEWMGSGDDAREAADRASLRALQIAPDLAEAHVARAAVLAMRGDSAGAARECAEAIHLDPSSFDAHYLYARICFQSGRFDESVVLFRRASVLRLEDFQSLILLELPLERLGRSEEAAAARREGLRRAERQLELEPDNPRALVLGACVLISEGERDRALEWARRAEQAAPDDPTVLLNGACVYARARMVEEALASLETMFGRGIGKRDWVERDPDYDSLRDDPRFQAMLARLA
ncbi:MAG TPA: tetratricopeptide repeat protein, partial [Kofleriaceae bacterium]|nr:tetratricopeptide repeat protein [Kofleriaceae bacterium]